MELVRSSISIVSGLPCVTVRSAPAIIVSGPAQRSLTLWPARSRGRLATLSIESSDSFVASTAVSIATGWNEPVPGRELHPLKSSAFHGALLRQLSGGQRQLRDRWSAGDGSPDESGDRGRARHVEPFHRLARTRASNRRRGHDLWKRGVLAMVGGSQHHSRYEDPRQRSPKEESILR